MRFERRSRQWAALRDHTFDVTVVGGGINGVCIYHQLCSEGFSVLLVDKGDFASGTSQSSAMMIWGGLLYLRNWDLLTVRRLCASRDRMLNDLGEWIRPSRFRYIPVAGATHRPLLVRTALYLYWLLGSCRRRCPHGESSFPEQALLAQGRNAQSLIYEEACVEPSDARFVVQWLLPHQNHKQTAFNYCTLEGGAFDKRRRLWHLELTDSVSGSVGEARSRWVVNAAGVWTDTINERFKLTSPYKHVLSKGVFLGLRRDERHRVPLIFETRNHGDAMSLIPWGPVSLWGPTETSVETLEEGFTVGPEDVRTLLDELNRHLASPVTAHSVVSLRCGVRPLAVLRSFNKRCYPLDLSRRHRVHRDERLPWLSVYGGKLTNCVPVARQVVRALRRAITPDRGMVKERRRRWPTPPLESFPDLRERIPAADWCAEREMCWTLEDYLRRRTNVSQWVARGGLGKNNEHAEHLTRLAGAFCGRDENQARRAVEAYKRRIVETFDRPLACSL